jgi:hypothetical protein
MTGRAAAEESAGEDDEPLGEGEAAAGAASAEVLLDETLDERVEAVLEDLDGVRRRRDGGWLLLSVGTRVFAVLGADLLEVALAPAIATAALRTADTRPSARGAGWIAFTPKRADAFALDRAEAWVRLAHRRALD